VQVAKLPRHDTELVLVVTGEHRDQELDVRVAPAQSPQEAEIGNLDAVAASSQRRVGPAHRAHLERQGQAVFHRNPK
jgi:hypothetical protein